MISAPTSKTDAYNCKKSRV